MEERAMNQMTDETLISERSLKKTLKTTAKITEKWCS